MATIYSKTPIIITPLYTELNSNLSLNDIARKQAGIHDDFEITDFQYNVGIIPKLIKNSFEDISFTGLSVINMSNIMYLSGREGLAQFLARNVLLCNLLIG